MANMTSEQIVNGGLAEIYITIDGERKKAAYIKEFNADVELNVGEYNVLGEVDAVYKYEGKSGSFDGSMYNNTSEFKVLLEEFTNTKKFPQIDIVVTSCDPSTNIGTETIALYDCFFDKIPLLNNKAGESGTEIDISGKFRTHKVLQAYTEISYD